MTVITPKTLVWCIKAKCVAASSAAISVSASKCSWPGTFAILALFTCSVSGYGSVAGGLHNEVHGIVL